MLTDIIKKTRYSSAVIPFYVHVSNVRSDDFDRFGRKEKLSIKYCEIKLYTVIKYLYTKVEQYFYFSSCVAYCYNTNNVLLQ